MPNKERKDSVTYCIVEPHVQYLLLKLLIYNKQQSCRNQINIAIRQQPKLSTEIKITHIIQRIILNNPSPKQFRLGNHSNEATTHRAITRFIIHNTSTLSYSSFGVYTHHHINIYIKPKQTFPQFALIKTAQKLTRHH